MSSPPPGPPHAPTPLTLGEDTPSGRVLGGMPAADAAAAATSSPAAASTPPTPQTNGSSLGAGTGVGAGAHTGLTDIRYDGTVPRVAVGVTTLASAGVEPMQSQPAHVNTRPSHTADPSRDGGPARTPSSDREGSVPRGVAIGRGTRRQVRFFRDTSSANVGDVVSAAARRGDGIPAPRASGVVAAGDGAQHSERKADAKRIGERGGSGGGGAGVDNDGGAGTAVSSTAVHVRLHAERMGHSAARESPGGVAGARRPPRKSNKRRSRRVSYVYQELSPTAQEVRGVRRFCFLVAAVSWSAALCLPSYLCSHVPCILV